MQFDRKTKMTTALSAIAYAGFLRRRPQKIRENLKIALESEAFKPYTGSKELIWGPAVHRSLWFNDALMFVVHDRDDDEYTLVIRGTNPVSLAAWLFQDFWIGFMCCWKRKLCGGNAKISLAARIALYFHTRMKPARGLPGAGMRLLRFLRTLARRTKDEIRLNVTGHSLGGLMASTLALLLHDKMRLGRLRDIFSIHAYSYGAPTAGNRAFAEYTEEALNRSGERFKLVRYCNTHDIASLVWNPDNMDKLKDLYRPAGIEMNDAERLLLSVMRGAVGRKDYMQPGTARELKGEIKYFLQGRYLDQALHQHIVPYISHIFEVSDLQAANMLIAVFRGEPLDDERGRDEDGSLKR